MDICSRHPRQGQPHPDHSVILPLPFPARPEAVSEYPRQHNYNVYLVLLDVIFYQYWQEAYLHLYCQVFHKKDQVFQAAEEYPLLIQPHIFHLLCHCSLIPDILNSENSSLNTSEFIRSVIHNQNEQLQYH